MKQVFYVIVFFLVSQVQAQKATNKSFSSKGISALVIDGNMVFKMHIETAKTQTISIQSLAEGEYSEEVVLITQIKNNTLYISSKFQPRSEEHTSELQSRENLVCRLLLEKKNFYISNTHANQLFW